ncbi:Txe/YoeB family addiction module toxin [Siphonobacter aquaeclarae]|jgi:toxin YoeB|uniref:Putative mRNA interferase YoeB n=1 Tax=Siphonobacter aquaeclarae TaxID=563176 RepID=A0A1G9TGW3_9BACT|nr:Txe/YoeB family addiction module toxin [Siphonobacter aquaeclarae]MBO9640649.1 Txe/YoeB family addiction module toxin [Siphonobacter aquaeclarae]SDM46872.1 toxin YoeB [Siphonobacter aquaeclarae]
MKLKRKLVFDNEAYEDFLAWAHVDRKNFYKINDLLRTIQQLPFDGKGRPQPLNESLKGFWSRQISDGHRLIYEVTDQEIRVIACKDYVA